MAYGTTAPVTLAKPASSTRRIAAAGAAVLLVGACVTALVSQHAGLELTSHVQQGNFSAAQTDLVWEDRVKLFREFKLAVASSENLTSDVAIIDTGKTSQSLCLNKKLADLTTSHEDQQTRNEGVIGDGPWTSKGVRIISINHILHLSHSTLFHCTLCTLTARRRLQRLTRRPYVVADRLR